ncbi:MAG: TonB-dependent receptor [Verrucomicrobia bacterium]|nr:TonB-dependent receptor [Verrucomicrobiota bacterium]
MHISISQFGLPKKTILGLSAWFGLFATQASFAIEDEESKIHDLDQYVVISSRTELRLEQVGSSVDIFTATDFEKSKQSFLSETLRTVPGLVLRNNGGSGQVFGMTTRGLNTNRPTVLIDGIEVSNPGSGQMLNFGTLSTSGVERVEVLKGAQSSLYGADALAGVISIHMKDGSREPGSSLDVMAGAYETYQASASTWGNFNNWTYHASVSWYDSQGYSVQDPDFGEAWADDDHYRNLNALLNLGYDFADTSSLKLVVYYIDSKAEFDPGDPSFIFGEPFADNYTETEQTFAKLALSFQPSDNWDSSLSAGMNKTRDFSFSSFPLASDGDRFELDWNNTVQASDSYKLVAGAKYEKEENKSDVGNRDERSLFLENIVILSEKLVLTLGGRYDDNSAYGDETTYRGTFSYILDETEDRFLKLRGSYGTSFQAPTFFQLFSSFGDPALKPESGVGWDFGLESSFDNGILSVGVTYFDYSIKDKIVFSFASFTFANEDRYFSQGVESFANVQFDEDLVLNLSYTYADAEYDDGSSAERVPHDILSVGLNWETLNDKLLLNLSSLYVGQQLSLRGDSQKMSDYVVLNLAGTYDLNETWDIWARIDNLLDEDYQEIMGFQTASFSVYAGARIRF